MKHTFFIYIFFLLLLSNCTSFNSKPDNVKDKTGELFLKAGKLVKYNKYNDAVLVLDKIIRLDSNYINAYLLRALVREINGEYDLSIKDLQYAIRIDPHSYIAHFNLGNQYFMKADYTTAINHYSLSIQNNPDYPAPYLNRANSYLKLENFKMALIDYKKYITMSDNQKEEIIKMISALDEKIELIIEN